MRFPTRIQVVVDSLYTLFLRRRHTAKLVHLEQKFDGLVCSPGGVATTAVMKHISRFLQINDPGDIDGLKHLPRPPATSIPVLYIFGQGEQIVASLERRNYGIPHLVKLGGLSSLVAGTLFGRRPKVLATLIRKQLEEFSNVEQRGGQVLCVEFEELWDSAEAIADFFGIDDQTFIDEFPKRQKRNTDDS